MPKRHRSRSHSRDRVGLSSVLKKIERRLSKLENLRKRRRTGSPSYSLDSSHTHSDGYTTNSSSYHSGNSGHDHITASEDKDNNHTAILPEQTGEVPTHPSNTIMSIFTAEGDSEKIFSAAIQPELAA
ncbi:unnamed protein product [Acanthoscelides obtectus]|uniref:Uncharacterized protein n=1 Tax=Acanthoscelides obtectus TaxID=200917 RepID=A0A9P0KJW9_ACAOB|nr:unnamed protein product [Acanthoscelides obtectus]CAK1667556.1 hypothetical protein AOBTE_LOCUS25907 [Acanthoscelides obtectus]